MLTDKNQHVETQSTIVSGKLAETEKELAKTKKELLKTQEELDKTKDQLETALKNEEMSRL